MEYYPAYLPSVKDEIELIKIYGAPTVAITVNSAKMTEQEARIAATQYSQELGIPAILPLEDGVSSLVPMFEKLIKTSLG